MSQPTTLATVNRWRRKSIRLLVLLVLLPLLQCVPQVKSLHAWPPAAGRSAPLDTLAVIGSRVIDSREFEQRYVSKMLEAGFNDSYEMRQKYLSNLVNDEILLLLAKAQGRDRSQEARAELERIRTQKLLDAYFEKHVAEQVSVTEEELHNLFTMLNTKVQVRHLYNPTKQGADSLYRRLLGGASFFKLARESFTDPVLRENGGLLGYIECDEMDPEFERVAFAMDVGQTSEPVKTVQGYSIIRVEARSVNPFQTETEYARSRERLVAFARTRKANEMAKRFSWSLRKTLQIEFDHALLHRLFLTAQPDGLQMTIENPAQTISAADRNKTVVVSREGSLTVDGLIRELGAVSESARRWTRSEENFEDLVAGLVIRNHCLREAKREKLDQSLQVEQEVAWAFDTHLLDAFERELKEQFTVSADSVKSYYDEHKELFRSEPEVRLSGILLGDAVVSDSLRRLLEQGIPFEALARTYSIQRQTASSGGDLGYLRRRDLGRFAKDMFSLKQDAWAGPFTDDGKYLFVKRTGLKEPAYRSYEDCESEIRATIGALSWEANRRRFIESSGVPVRVFSQKLAGPFLSSSNP